jgi:hypothetical protein
LLFRRLRITSSKPFSLRTIECGKLISVECLPAARGLAWFLSFHCYLYGIVAVAAVDVVDAVVDVIVLPGTN